MRPLFIFLLLWAGFCACSDKDQEEGLKLTADRNTILSTGTDEVRFTVTLDGKDVTAESVIKEQESGETVVNGVFVTTVAGVYAFAGEYEGMKTETVTVTAEKGEGFKKNVLAIKFTAVGCHTCPEAEKAIRLAEKSLPGRVYPMAVYGTLGQTKDFMIDEYINSFKKYFVFNEYPTVVLDHSDKWNYRNGVEDMAFEKTRKAKGDIGIALETGWTGDQLSIKVKVKSSKTIDYSTNVAVAILESGLYAVQAGAWTEDDNYHHHVVRHYLTDLYGEEYKIEKGRLNPSEEYIRDFTYTVPVEFKKANLEVMVYLLRTSDKTALNCQRVTAGKNVGYEAL